MLVRASDLGAHRGGGGDHPGRARRRPRQGRRALGRVRAVAGDKTGTLTSGRPALADVAAAPGHRHDEVLGLAAAVEAASEHPLADAIVRGARDRGIDVPPATGLHAIPGVGVKATVDGRRLFVGRPKDGCGWAADRVAELETQGRTAVVLTEGDTVLGCSPSPTSCVRRPARSPTGCAASASSTW